MRRLAAAALLLLWASGARAEATRPVCFIGPVFLTGVADNACVSGAKERKRLLDTEVVDWKRKPAPLVMRGDKPKDKITVTTCRRWLRAISLSRVAMRAEDRGREAFYQRTCQTLDQLKFAMPARKVYLTSNGRDLLRPAVVPARLLEQAGIKGPLALPGTGGGGRIPPAGFLTGVFYGKLLRLVRSQISNYGFKCRLRSNQPQRSQSRFKVRVARTLNLDWLLVSRS